MNETGRKPEAADARPGPADRRTVLADERTEMAFERTRFAADRTLMAWMRTALALLGFGFSIYKFFQYLKQSGLAEGDWKPNAPRLLAIILMALGLIFLLAAMAEYVVFVRRLARVAGRPLPQSFSPYAAAILWLIGLLALMVVTFRAGPV